MPKGEILGRGGREGRGSDVNDTIVVQTPTLVQNVRTKLNVKKKQEAQPPLEVAVELPVPQNLQQASRFLPVKTPGLSLLVRLLKRLSKEGRPGNGHNRDGWLCCH